MSACCVKLMRPIEPLKWERYSLKWWARHLVWNVYKQQSPAGPVTRRLMLSYISSMFDPLGFISAITLRGKMLFQEATRLQLDWDTPVPDALAHSWMEWLQSLPELDTLKFNRCMIPGEFADGVTEVHNFCNGSQASYGCCSYIRVINETGQIHVALITAKLRLAPLKRITVPRLELASAVLAVKMNNVIRREALCDHYSSFYKLKKAAAWLLRTRDHLLKRDKPRGPMHFPEMHAAETLKITFVQERVYGAEMASLKRDGHVARTSSLQKISPVVADGLLVVGGHLKHAPAALRLRNPIILPYRHGLSTLIVLECHGGTHLGTELVLSKLRTRFWIVGARKLIKKIKCECVTSKRLYARPMSQKMADLLPERCLPGQPPFAYVGVDLFGPIYVKQGRADVKRYGCLYTCFNSRAIHIEKLDSLETDTFINGFVRFVARRGEVLKVWSDNATNLVGTQAELARSLRGLDRLKVIAAARRRHVSWEFNPPLASHHGGVWERQIRTLRRVLMAVLSRDTRLTDDILHTIFCEIGNIVNSRPMTKISDDVTDDVPLTPNHLLLMRGNFSNPWGVFYDGEAYRRHWKHAQNIVKVFWKRWLREYLPELQKRQKWLGIKSNLKVGDLVLVMDENAPRGSWPLGLIQEVSVCRDGLVRSARLKTVTSVLTRPITKLVSLECDV